MDCNSSDSWSLNHYGPPLSCESTHTTEWQQTNWFARAILSTGKTTERAVTADSLGFGRFFQIFLKISEKRGERILLQTPAHECLWTSSRNTSAPCGILEESWSETKWQSSLFATNFFEARAKESWQKRSLEFVVSTKLQPGRVSTPWWIQAQSPAPLTPPQSPRWLEWFVLLGQKKHRESGNGVSDQGAQLLAGLAPCEKTTAVGFNIFQLWSLPTCLGYSRNIGFLNGMCRTGFGDCFPPMHPLGGLSTLLPPSLALPGSGVGWGTAVYV